MVIQLHDIFFPGLTIVSLVGLLVVVLFLRRELKKMRVEISSVRPLFHVSHREHEVLELVCKGDSNKTIAEKLKISEQTVKNHVSALMEKCGAHSRIQLANAARISNNKG